MSEHNWFQENTAAYLTGGLESTERDRLERHAAECPDCATTLTKEQALDRVLISLFAKAQPQPALEDRMIQTLRVAPIRIPWRFPVSPRVGAGIAATLLMGVTGATVSSVVQDGLPTFPDWDTNRTVAVVDSSASMSLNNLKQTGLATHASSDGRNAEISARVSREQTKAPRIRKGSEWADAASLTGAPLIIGEDAGAGIQVDRARAVERAKTGAGASYRNPAPASSPLSASPSSATPTPLQGTSSLGTWEAGFKPAEVFFRTPTGEVEGKNQAGKEDGKDLQKLEKAQEGKLERVEEKLLKEVEKLAEQKPDEKAPARGGDPDKAPEAKPAAAAPVTRRIIRSGDIEFEVESFDGSVAAITKLVAGTQGGFIATINSEKLPNGKVRGAVVVRVPPEQLDTLVLDLRRELGKGGELKGQRIGSQDITKQYTDLESRLKAARAMEERLLKIIKDGKGEIKQLLEAEKELGLWRTKIEEYEGELRYYGNLVALSTLTVNLTEREIRAAAEVVQTERVEAAVEVEDVDQALRAALKAVEEAKGRVTKSEMKQHSAGQFNALLHFEVSPDAAGTVRDRLKQLGNLARLEISRSQQTEGGREAPRDAKVRRGDTQFQVALYNLTNVLPRETVVLHLTGADDEEVYRKVLARVEKAAGTVVRSNLSRQQGVQTVGVVHFQVKAAEADAVLTDLKEVGEVLRLVVSESTDLQNTTRSKRGFQVQIVALSQVQPRETENLTVVAADVPAAHRALQEVVTRVRGRILHSSLNEQNRQNIQGKLEFDVRRAEEAAIRAALDKAGETLSRTVTRSQSGDTVLDSLVRFSVTLDSLNTVAPRETIQLTLEVPNVDQTLDLFTAQVREAQGRRLQTPNVNREFNGHVTAHVFYDVPLTAAPGLLERFRSAGNVRVNQTTSNPQAPEGKLATARFDVTLSNPDPIVASDDGLWAPIRRGLAFSVRALSVSAMWLVVGLCVVLPWGLVLYGSYRAVKHLRRNPQPTRSTASSP